ncbi:uncharacterized protein N7459_003962 [Penicillium hispanicum]|uniref:uncharacterized protein n=1 Tax=Penicillium hispanicum TaxID=1080232 RepID=UPI00254206F2|nr:uncharacterized protein N7459_003962 [Penicillium hispanicum]KAJ5584162.1 hypothetical protein N7459_003962 [Penicillium hispanicum]
MDIKKAIDGLQPLRGEIIPIRTVQETRPPEEFGDAYVAEVNIKAASKLIKILDSAFPRPPSLPLSHLRRFAKRETLPASLQAAVESGGSPPVTPAQSIFVVIPPPLPDVDELQSLLAPFVPDASGSATPSASQSTSDVSLEASMSGQLPPKIRLITIKVPIYPPFNPSQAEKWSNTLWPVVFNPAAPRSTVAPPPQILSRAQETIQPRAGYYLSLARKVAEEAEQSGRGRGVGAVVVDPAIEADIEAAAEENGQSSMERWMDAVLAVGGDARYGRGEAGGPSQLELHRGVIPNPASMTFNADIEGGPDLHALMRAVELVARRRREDAMDGTEMAAIPKPMAVLNTDPQLSTQLSPLESYFLYEADTLANASSAARRLSPSSPKKRKHEEPNPESRTVSLESDNDLSSQSDTTPPFPAPPLSIATQGEPSIPQSLYEPSQPESAATLAPPNNSRIRPRSQGGYLCTDLDIYISHEPCLCCSMGMLLSRFRAVIFPRSGRMKSGGLASEPIVAPITDDHRRHDRADGDDAAKDPTSTDEKRLYYGLHWRKELNWRALGFEFVEDEGEATENGSPRVDFHA